MTETSASALPVSSLALDGWFSSKRGQRLASAEQMALANCLPPLFGRTIVQLGSWGSGDADPLIERAQMPVKLVLGSADAPRAHEHARFERTALPLAKGQIDAVLLPHTLEYAKHPHRLLRQAEGVLSPRGYVLVLGFNPLSLFSLRQRWTRGALRGVADKTGLRHPALPDARQLISVHRLTDWLRLLDCEPIALHRFGVGFPWLPQTSLAQRFGPRRAVGMLHEGYLLCARKRTIPLTPAQSRLRASADQLAGAGLAGAVRLPFPPAAARQLDDPEEG